MLIIVLFIIIIIFIVNNIIIILCKFFGNIGFKYFHFSMLNFDLKKYNLQNVGFLKYCLIIVEVVKVPHYIVKHNHVIEECYVERRKEDPKLSPTFFK